jgi:Ca2+-binding RTX toxin-like protein
MPVIIGTSNPETLVGTADADQIYGLGGNDILYGGDGGDTFFWTYWEGMDSVNGEAGIDTQVINVSGPPAIGGPSGSPFVLLFELRGDPTDSARVNLKHGSDFFSMQDAMFLTSVENFTVVSTRADGLYLTVQQSAISGTVTLNAIATPLNASRGVQMIAGSIWTDSTVTTRLVGLGSHRADLFKGGDANDVFYGYAGNDVLYGDGGLNELAGGLGDDDYHAHDRDTLIEAPGEGTDTVHMFSNFYEMKANFENLTFEGWGNFTGIGNDAANVIRGGSGADYLIGLGGDDTIFDHVSIPNVPALPNTLQGGIGNDRYLIAIVGDTIVEFAGEGTDTVVMPFPIFTLVANVENLIYDSNDQTSRLTGNAEGNAITGGNVTRDYLIGLDGNDRLEGLSGTDILDGGAGDDILIGGGNADEMSGGAGADMFVISRLIDGVDGIHDFARAQGDRIDITAFTAEIGAPGPDPFASGKLVFKQVADFGGAPATHVLYDPDGSGPGGSALFLWVRTGGDTLTSADFVF